MAVTGDDIADVVLKQFEALPSKRKPLTRSDGFREWVPLSGIAAQEGEDLRCLSLATGMKCLRRDKVPLARGLVLHDWHAEVLAIRSLNRLLLEECHALAQSPCQPSQLLRLCSSSERTEGTFQPFALKAGIKLHLYCSEAPCGDASMEVIQSTQEDGSPWAVPISTVDNAPTELLGRAYFSQLGIVRRKPSRPDAPISLSKSCSDKLALHQCTSMLNSMTSLLISPSNIYLSSLILPSSQYIATACRRAFSEEGRLKELKGKDWGNGYPYTPFQVITTEKEFQYSRRATSPVPGQKFVPSNLAACWSPNHSESLIGGVIQGRKQFDARGASKVCKAQMWKLAREIAATLDELTIEKCLSLEEYGKIKSAVLLDKRQEVKRHVRDAALRPWVRNEGGDDFESFDAHP